MAATGTLILRSQLLERRGRLESARTAHPDAVHLARLLDEVDTALERMDRGVYGLCEACHDPVESERLLAESPDALLPGASDDAAAGSPEQDLDMAARIQATLLPNRRVQAGGWEACYYYQPLGPVSGDSMSSARVWRCRRRYRICMPFSAVCCRSRCPSAFCWSMEICSGGHCPPVLVRHGEVCTIEAAAPAPGLFSTSQSAARHVFLEPGDSLVPYTDGLTESRDKTR